MKKYHPIDTTSIKTYSIKTRNNKVNVDEHFGQTVRAGMSSSELLDAMPKLLGAESLHAVADKVVEARRRDRPVVLAMGGHVIKCGLQPTLKALIDADIITAVAMNGSATIHDFEVSLVGATSEEVGDVLHSGDFGFSDETGAGMNRAIKAGLERDIGFAQAVGEWILAKEHTFKNYSLIATCVEKGLPVTAHVAMGTDIIHQHPEMDGAVTGEMSMRDFRLITSVVADLGDGGVWLNVGSAVIMPEVFLKAFSIAQNLGHHVDNFTTANFDMNQHYRPMQNVIKRPTSGSGKGYSIVGHHEINIPLLAAVILDKIGKGA